jgi:hypothetical protein
VTAVAPRPTGAPVVAPVADRVRPIGEARWRQRIAVEGHVRSMRVRPWAGEVGALELTLVDETGGLTVVFLGRTRIGGIGLGARMEVEGMVGESGERLVILNPVYRLVLD